MAVDDYNDLIEAAARRYNVDPNLIRSVMHVESRGDPRAHNRESDARGLMQIIPDTARRLGVRDPHDPAQAIDAGARHLAASLDRHGDPARAILEYHGGTNPANWGPRTQTYLMNVADRYGRIIAPQGQAGATPPATQEVLQGQLDAAAGRPLSAPGPTYTEVEINPDGTLTPEQRAAVDRVTGGRPDVPIAMMLPGQQRPATAPVVDPRTFVAGGQGQADPVEDFLFGRSGTPRTPLVGGGTPTTAAQIPQVGGGAQLPQAQLTGPGGLIVPVANAAEPARAAAPQGAVVEDPVDQFLMGVQRPQVQRPDPTTGQVPPPRRETTGLERFGAGLGRGVRDVVDAPAAWLAERAESSGLTGALRNSALGRFLESSGVPITTGQQAREGNATERQTFERDYGDSGLALAGRVGGQVAATVPVLRAGGALLGGAGAITGAAAPTLTAPIAPAARALYGAATPANPLLRFGARAANGVVQGTAGAALALDPTQETAPQLALGAGAGAVGNAVIAPALSSGVNGLRQFFAPGTNPQTVALAQRAEQLGVPVRGSQISDSPFIRWLDETLQNVPGSGQVGRNVEQRSQFTRAVSRAIGENTDTITPDVLQAAERRIGGVMDDVARRTTLAVDNQFVNDLARIEADLTRIPLPEGEVRALSRQLDDVLNAAAPGTMSGEAYQAFTRFGTPLSRAQRSPDPNIRHFSSQVREALDGMLERSAPPDLVAGLRQARSQWRAMVNVIEPMVERSPTGQVDPAALLTRIRAAYPDFLRRGTGGTELGDLAMIGAQFMPRMPNSGTAQRLAIGAGLANTGAYLMDPGMLATGLGVTAGTALTARGAGGVLASDMYRNMLLGRGIPGAIGRGVDATGAAANRLIDVTAVPGVVSGARQDWYREPDYEMTVTPQGATPLTPMRR